MVNKHGAKITTLNVVKLYAKPFNQSANIEKALNGVKSSCIYPLDKEKFKITFESFSTYLRKSHINY